MDAHLAGHYPTDPTKALEELAHYFTGQGDIKCLVHGLYDLSGFCLNIFIGEPDHIVVDPAIVADSVNKVIVAMHSAPTQSGAAPAPVQAITLPDWAKPILVMGLQALLAWIQGQMTLNTMQRTGAITSVQP